MSGRGRPWTPKESKLLLKNWGKHGTVWCAEKLGRSVNVIAAKAEELGLRPVEKATGFSTTLLLSARYSPDQLEALDAIGEAYRAPREGVIDFETACELRELVKRARIDEALERLELMKERAA